jgi:hypothetical protein
MFCHLKDGSWRGLAAPRQKGPQYETKLIETESDSMPSAAAQGSEKATGA